MSDWWITDNFLTLPLSFLKKRQWSTQCLKITEKVAFNIKKTWRCLRSKSVTRHITFDRTKIDWKNWKYQMRHFGWFSNTVEVTSVYLMGIERQKLLLCTSKSAISTLNNYSLLPTVFWFEYILIMRGDSWDVFSTF